ncbi:MULTISPECIES: helix-turn-helix domain-containing protein [Clostridium]|uniref:helix-turn-helix domain-containing protein n=1 Tax=Clostridium TaxID=1485 RepID=UPI000826DE76|nr:MULTISPECIES: helix-turn-helix transcriptional regulator [Clostridium]PJI06818.1 XRE family transcriptional regulator [Clostridium sp. CT7]
MKEINLAKVLVNKRREKGITQEELANYIGVSKASVSKWETGLSYPDIVFLPQLAAYFNISVDELIGYEPQMTKEDIKRLYHKLAADFAEKPFDEVKGHCHKIIKKYYSCFPLLLQMGILLLNHSLLLKDRDEQIALLDEAKELFIRVKLESEDVELARQALNLEAACCLYNADPKGALELLDDSNNRIMMPNETIIATAYQMLGKNENAKEILQISMYQYILSLIDAFSLYSTFYIDDKEKYEEIFHRVFTITKAFNMEKLHPTFLLKVYICAAQGYASLGEQDRALDILNKYTEISIGDIYPIKLHGDDFFDLLDDWLLQLDLGIKPVTDEKTIKQNMLNSVIGNPNFAVLKDNSRFKSIVEKLKNNCEEA